MAESSHKRLEDLLILAMDDKISSEQTEELNTLLRGHPHRIRLAVQFLQVASHLKQSKKMAALGKPWLTGDSQDSFTGFMKLMAEYENTAQTVEIKKSEEATERILIRPVPVRFVRPRVSRFSIYTLLVSSAALLCLIAYVTFGPTVGHIETATLTDSIQAQWAPSEQAQMKNGVRLAVRSGPIWLQEGLAELQFDNSARILIEGPAEFEIVAEDRLSLEYGKVYAIVPPEAIGFSVYTRNAKVIDLGTEFGIEIDGFGNTLLHTIKGQTRLIAGPSTAPVSVEISQGQARKISADTQTVTDIPCNMRLFVREIDSQNDFVWRGQRTLDLADIVGGGNGLGTGTIDLGIDPISGTPAKGVVLPELRTAANEYHRVVSSPYIDGVFIPKGQPKQIISSQGHIFRECPNSSGSCYGNIVNAIRILDSQEIQNTATSERWNAHCLLMHANMGITYDFRAIRDLLPGIRIVRFQSKFGVEKETVRPSAVNADFWVLVDGQLRYNKTQIKDTNLYSVDIELSEKDRFLTLVTTDGQDADDRVADGLVLSTIDSDWCRFADPVLILE